jgi:hypothetical protein
MFDGLLDTLHFVLERLEQIFIQRRELLYRMKSDLAGTTGEIDEVRVIRLAFETSDNLKLEPIVALLKGEAPVQSAVTFLKIHIGRYAQLQFPEACFEIQDGGVQPVRGVVQSFGIGCFVGPDSFERDFGRTHLVGLLSGVYPENGTFHSSPACLVPETSSTAVMLTLLFESVQRPDFRALPE